MEYGATAYNRIVCAAPAVAGLAYEKPQSGCALCAVFLRHILPAAGIATQFLYRGGKNVAYNLNVRCNFAQIFFKKIDKKNKCRI
jgi:hypothetical protein